MDGLVAALSVLVGATLIGLVLRDLFYTLAQPSGMSQLSWAISRATWRVARRISPSVLHLAGPVMVVLTIASWSLLVALGWAFVYWPWLPDGFVVTGDLARGTVGGFADALYFSLVTLATLGYGEIAPVDTWLRLLAPLEAVLGFLILTAAITWLLSIYPATSRQRTLAREVRAYLTARDTAADPEQLGGELLEAWRLEHFTRLLFELIGDLDHFPSTYYYRARDERDALPLAIASLDRLGADGGAARVATSRRMLEIAIDDLSQVVASRYLHLPPDAASRHDVLSAYAADHGYTVPGATERAGR